MNERRSSIVILTPGFPSSESDTTCLPMQQQFVNRLREMNEDREIIVLSLQYPYVRSRYTWKGIRVESFNGRNRGGLVRQWLRREVAVRLVQLHAANPIAMLLSFWCGECAFVGKKFGDANGITHRCWLMGQDARKNNGYPRSMKVRPGELIAISSFVQEEFARNHGIRPACVVTPGVDQRMVPDPESARDIDILGVGSLIPLKRYDWYLDTVASLIQERPGTTVVLIGDGPERTGLERKAAELGIDKLLRFAGTLSYPEVLTHMRRSRLLLHPSSYEGFPGVCLEALACGCPVVGTLSPMHESIDGWSIANSRDELYKHCLRILESPAPEIGLPLRYDINECVKRISAEAGPRIVPAIMQKKETVNLPG